MAQFVGGKQTKSLSRIMFDKYDTDGSGYIDSDEFKNMLIGQGIYLSDESVGVALKTIDHNGDKRISYEEFLEWKKTSSFDYFQMDQDKLNQMIRCAQLFDLYDTNNDGSLNLDELISVHRDMKDAGMFNDDLTVEDLLREMDIDGDGLTEYNEFVMWMDSKGFLG